MSFAGLQTNLKAAGYHPGDLDGHWGPATLAALLGAMVRRQPDAFMHALAEPMARQMPPAGITGRLRVLHFLAQAAEETAAWRTLTEYGDDAYFAKYDGRADLGNSQPGDGFRFRGRGPLMLTGRANYVRCAGQLQIALGIEPDTAATPVIGTRAAVWFWGDKGCNAFADADQIVRLTQAINGGPNGLSARRGYLAAGKAVWGA